MDARVALDDVGREQARTVARRLAEVRFQAILTSPLERCRETAEIVAKRRRSDLPIHTEVDLAEARYGDGRLDRAIARGPGQGPAVGTGPAPPERRDLPRWGVDGARSNPRDRCHPALEPAPGEMPPPTWR